MELKRKLSPRIVFVSLYFVCFAIYLIYGLMPAEAARFVASDRLTIPSINLETDVAELALEGSELPTPDTIAGSFSMNANKTLLTGHSTTVFQDLIKTKLGDTITYSGKEYTVTKLEYKIKSAINMSEVLKSEKIDTIVIMTCAGKLLDGGDASHRFMVTATVLD